MCHSAWTFEQTHVSLRGYVTLRGRGCLARARWIRCSYAARRRGSAPEEYPGTGHTREEDLPGPERWPGTPKRGHAGRPNATGAVTPALPQGLRDKLTCLHGRTAKVWCCEWRLQSGCRPSLQRCVSTGPETSLEREGPRFSQTVEASHDRIFSR